MEEALKALPNIVDEVIRRPEDVAAFQTGARASQCKMGRQAGFAARTIYHHAEKTSGNLIVTCTHGRTNLPHVLIGSVAEQIVRDAKTPVLVLPAHAKQEHHFSH